MSGIYSSGQAPNERDTTLRDLLAVIFKRKWLILGIFGVTTALILAKTLASPTTYSAEATLLLNRQGARASALERVSKQLPWVEVVESEVEVIQSTPVLQSALERLRDAESGTPVEIGIGALAASIHVGIVGESNVLYITGTADSPETAVRITNAVAEAYVEYHDNLFRLPDPIGVIRSRTESVYATLDSLENERVELLSALGTGDTAYQDRALGARREALQQDLASTEREISRLQTQIEDASRFLVEGTGVFPFAENSGSVQGGAIMDLIRRLNRKKEELEQLRLKYTEDHPTVLATAHEVTSMQKAVNSQVRQVIAGRRHELNVERRTAATLKRQIQELDEEIDRLVQGSGNLATLDAQIDALRSQYRQLSNQSVESEITQRSYLDYDVKILSQAIGAHKNAKGDMVRLALGPILALMVGIGFAFYLENLDHSVTNREDVEQHLAIPVLASFPEDPDADLTDDEGIGSRTIPFQRPERKKSS